MTDQDLSDEMADAASRATAAHAAFKRTPPTASTYQKVLNEYLQATILYMSMVSVCQARRHERVIGEILDLAEEVAELREQLRAFHPLVH